MLERPGVGGRWSASDIEQLSGQNATDRQSTCNITMQHKREEGRRKLSRKVGLVTIDGTDAAAVRGML